jgi:hypothetical protein
VNYPADPGCSSLIDRDAESSALVCDDGLDDDGDARIDYPADPGCTPPNDGAEDDMAGCSDGVDNDRDGLVDHPADPGCAGPTADRYSWMCQDGIDNEGDGSIDSDGGASLHGGAPIAPPDAQCAVPYADGESPTCGLGAEAALALALVRRLCRRARVATWGSAASSGGSPA